jgi:arsenate reductase (glutaredoxin)
MKVTVYHNPRCQTSRKALKLVGEYSGEVEVIEYLREPPSAGRLKKLMAALGVDARGLMRRKEPLYASLGLAAAKWSEAELVGFMVNHPILIERPIVVTEKGVRIARPPETALEVL